MNKQQATQAGKKLKSLLRLKGKRILLVENNGWHPSVQNKFVRVHISVGDLETTYWAQMNPPYCMWAPEKHREFKDPNDAVVYTLKPARKLVDELEVIVAGAEKSVAQ